MLLSRRVLNRGMIGWRKPYPSTATLARKYSAQEERAAKSRRQLYGYLVGGLSLVVLVAVSIGVAVSTDLLPTIDSSDKWPAFPTTSDDTSTNYVSRPLLESQVLAIYNNSEFLGSYYIMYGVNGAGKTSIVYNALSGKPGVIVLRVYQGDSKKTIISNMHERCGLKEDTSTEIRTITEALHIAKEKRNGFPLTLVIQVEGESEGLEMLDYVQYLSEKFAKAANVLVVLSGTVGILGFGSDKRWKSIFVDEMTREEGEQYVKKRAPSISPEDFAKFADHCGTVPLLLAIFCDRVVNKEMTVDACIASNVASARRDLVRFRHQPILAELKSSPEGVRTECFQNVTNKGVRLRSPVDVAPAMMGSYAVVLDWEKEQYKLATQAHKTALKTYEPYNTKQKRSLWFW